MGRVEGAVYSGLTEEDLEALDDWELVELGWMVRNKGRARLVDGRLVNVAAFVITDGQEVEEKIEGSEYNPWIIGREDLIAQAKRTRKEYLERKSKNSP